MLYWQYYKKNLLLKEKSEEEEKNVKAVTESVSNNSNAPAASLGDNNDILAGLKAKMEKSEKKK